jgi:hypothetical protein
MNIIPFGEECYVAQSIDSKFNNCNFREEAYPFDYVGHAFIDSIVKKINSGFLVKKEDIEIMIEGEKKFLYDKSVDFRYWHECSKNFDDNKIADFLKKFNRRYKRLENLLISNKKIIIITGQHFDFIYKEQNRKDLLLELYDCLKKINKNIILLAFNYEKKNFIYENIKHFYIKVNYNLEFKLAKSEFIKEFNINIKNILINNFK